MLAGLHWSASLFSSDCKAVLLFQCITLSRKQTVTNIYTHGWTNIPMSVQMSN